MARTTRSELDPMPLVERQVGYTKGKEIISHIWHDHLSAVRIARLMRDLYRHELHAAA